MIYKKTIKLLIFLFVVIMLSHCTGAPKEGIPSYREAKSDNLPDDIGQLEDILKNNPDSSIRAKAHLQLALLHSSYKNPNPNYQLALKELENYMSVEPAGRMNEDIQNFLAILREMDKMLEENKKMKQRMGQLTKENKDLKDAVLQLKNLDISMEEKRKKAK